MDILAIGKLRTGDRPVQRSSWFMDGELLAPDGAAGGYAVCNKVKKTKSEVRNSKSETSVAVSRCTRFCSAWRSLRSASSHLDALWRIVSMQARSAQKKAPCGRFWPTAWRKFKLRRFRPMLKKNSRSTAVMVC